MSRRSRGIWLSLPGLAAFCVLLLVTGVIPDRVADPVSETRTGGVESAALNLAGGSLGGGVHVQLVDDEDDGSGEDREETSGSGESSVDPTTVPGDGDSVQIDYDLDDSVNREDLQQRVNEINARGRLSDTIRSDINGGVLGAPLDFNPDPWVDFEGTISLTSTGLRLSIPRSEVNFQISWWARLLAQGVGILSLLAIRTACYSFFTVGAFLAGPVCSALGSFSGAMIYQAIVIFVDGKQSDSREWGKALAAAMVAAVGSATWELGLNKFAKESMRPLYERFSAWVSETATTVSGQIGGALTWAGARLRELADTIYAEMERAFTAVTGTDATPPLTPADTQGSAPDGADTLSSAADDAANQGSAPDGADTLSTFIDREPAQQPVSHRVPAGITPTENEYVLAA